MKPYQNKDKDNQEMNKLIVKNNGNHNKRNSKSLQNRNRRRSKRMCKRRSKTISKYKETNRVKHDMNY